MAIHTHLGGIHIISICPRIQFKWPECFLVNYQIRDYIWILSQKIVYELNYDSYMVLWEGFQ